MAKKQSLIGVLFAAIDNGSLKPIDIDKHQDDFEDLLMEWMGEKVKIARRNEKLNQDVAEVAQWLSKEGYETCLLKGQGNTLLYPNPLLRTCGDIDLWIRPKVSNGLESDINDIISFVRKNASSRCRAIYHHIDCLDRNGTEVEIHYRPHFMQNFVYNARLQNFFVDNANEQFHHLAKALGNLVKDTVGFEGEIVWDTTKPNSTPRKLIDVSKLHSLGWHHKVEIEGGVKKLYEWYQSILK